MTRKRSCDQHVHRTVGCQPCTDRAYLYEKGRRLAIERGWPLSIHAQYCMDRLRELCAHGYSTRNIAARTGLSQKNVWMILNGQMRFVQLRTFRLIERAHAELSLTPGGNVRAANAAARRGWTPPESTERDEGLVDRVAVDRAIRGERVTLSRPEMNEAWQRLAGAGMNDQQIAARLHVTARTLQRWKKQAPTSRRGVA